MVQSCTYQRPRVEPRKLAAQPLYLTPQFTQSTSDSEEEPAMGLDLLTATAEDVTTRYENGSLTCVNLIRLHLQHIAAYNKHGPCLRALLSVVSEDKLMERARLLDKERRDGKVRGPLHGITFIVKDSIATHPDLGLATAAGSLALKDSRPAKGATIVEKLLKAGLILIGKGNLSELGHMRDSSLPCGWSSVGGQTQSAYVSSKLNVGGLTLDHSSPAGSSSGCAVAISAGFALLSVAQETRGSLNVPASRAALYALKPTRGSILMDGMIPISRRLDSPGCMAKSPSDLAAMTEIIMQKRSSDQSIPQALTATMNMGWKGLRIGFMDAQIWPLAPSLCKIDKAVRDPMHSEYSLAISKLRLKGVHVIRYIDLSFRSRMDEIDTGLESIMMHDFRPHLDEYLDELEFSKVRTLEGLIRWNDSHHSSEFNTKYSEQSTLREAVKNDTAEIEIKETMAKLQTMVGTEGVDLIMNHHKLDAIGVLMDSPICTISAATGLPYCTMPLGYSKKNGRPFGMAMLAKRNEEAILFRIMKAWEETFPARQPPSLPKLSQAPKLKKNQKKKRKVP